MKIFLNEKLKKINVLDERFYTLDNITFYPSVTTVLEVYPKGKHFKDWLKANGFNADTIMNKAATQGSNVHNAIEDILNGSELQWINKDGQEAYTLVEWQMINKYMEFHSQCVNEVVSIESMLFSETLKLGGTGDLVCMINGERWFIDHKTSKNIYKTNEIQLAVYKEMWDEMHPDQPIQRYGVLWLNAATRTNKEFQGVGWQIKEFTKNHEHNLKLYHHTRSLWDEENPNYKPKNLIYPSLISLDSLISLNALSS